MIRVLVLGLTDTIGGVENYLKELTLSSNKNDVLFDFLVKKGEKGCYEDDIIYFYGNSKCIHHVTRLKINLLKSFQQMKKIAANNRYDVIYINSCTSSDMLYAKLFFKGIPVVMHSHYSSSKFMFSNMLFRKAARNYATYRLACSKKAAEWMFGDTNETVIVHNGIDSSRFRYSDEKRKKIRDKYGIGDEDLLIGNIGRLTAQKNQGFLIKILKRIIDFNNEDHLFNRVFIAIVGVGPDEQKLQKLAKTIGIWENLIMPGAISNADEYYCGFDVFVMPSLYEGLPIAAIEAQCSGLVCFFSDKIDKQVLISNRSNMEHLAMGNDNYLEWACSIWDYCKKIDEYRRYRESYVKNIIDKGYDITTVTEIVCGVLKESST